MPFLYLGGLNQSSIMDTALPFSLDIDERSVMVTNCFAVNGILDFVWEVILCIFCLAVGLIYEFCLYILQLAENQTFAKSH